MEFYKGHVGKRNFMEISTFQLKILTYKYNLAYMTVISFRNYVSDMCCLIFSFQDTGTFY